MNGEKPSRRHPITEQLVFTDMEYKPKDVISCPHCNEELEDTADWYVVPGRVGSASASDEQCGYCDGWMAMHTLPNGNILVQATDGEGGDYID